MDGWTQNSFHSGFDSYDCDRIANYIWVHSLVFEEEIEDQQRLVDFDLLVEIESFLLRIYDIHFGKDNSYFRIRNWFIRP